MNAWLIETGLLDIAAGDPIGLVVETGCRYAGSLTYPEPVEIGFGVERLGNSSVTYRLGVFAKGDDEPAAEGTSSTSTSTARPAARWSCRSPGRAQLEAIGIRE